MMSTRCLAALAVGAALLAPTLQAGAAVRPGPGPKWHTQSSASFGAASQFNAVTTLRSRGTWAVGSTLDSDGIWHTLVEHRDGTGWTRQESPDPEPGSQLWGVAAVSGADVWAVGTYTT